MNLKKTTFLLLVCFFLISMISGCAEPNQAEGTDGSSGVAGFWAGLWQGCILPIAFVISLFKDGVGIYEIHNNGNLYNLGFVLGTWFVFGSILASSKAK